MHRFRFSLLAMFGFVALVAVACAALARPSQLWLVVVSASSLGCLFYAVLAAVYGRNARRAFWLGFAVVGWGYIALERESLLLPTDSVADGLATVLHGNAAPTPNYSAWSKTPPGAAVPVVTDGVTVWNDYRAATDATPPELSDDGTLIYYPRLASVEPQPSNRVAKPMPIEGQPTVRPGEPAPVLVATEPGEIAGPPAPGAGVMTLGEPGGVVPTPSGQMQIVFAGPEGLVVTWEVGPGQFDSEPLICPGRSNFPQGALYRLRLTSIPGREGVELFPTLEVGPSLPRTDAYLAHNAVPLQFTEEDFDQVMSNKCVTKAVYLPDPEFEELALNGIDTLVSTRLDPGVDSIVEADLRGEILAIVHIGSDGIRGIANGDGATAAGPGNGAALSPGLVANATAPPYAVQFSPTYVSVQQSATVDLEAFGQIIKWLWAILLGFIGGLVALRLYHRRERQNRQSAATN